MGNFKVLNSEGETVACSGEPPPPKVFAKKTKKNGKPAGEVVSYGVLSQAEPLQDHVHQIENFEKAEVLASVGLLEDKVSENYFVLGGHLLRIRENLWFEPYKSFREWVKARTGMSPSKANQLAQVYRALVEAGLPWASFKDVGWTKMRAIARVLTKANADHWIALAVPNSKHELEALVKKEFKTKAATNHNSSAPPHKLNFSLYEDQYTNVRSAFEKCMEQSQTEVPSQALEYICMDYLGTATLKSRLAAAGLDNAMKAMNEAFPGCIHLTDEVTVPDED